MNPSKVGSLTIWNMLHVKAFKHLCHLCIVHFTEPRTFQTPPSRGNRRNGMANRHGIIRNAAQNEREKNNSATRSPPLALESWINGLKLCIYAIVFCTHAITKEINNVQKSNLNFCTTWIALMRMMATGVLWTTKMLKLFVRWCLILMFVALMQPYHWDGRHIHDTTSPIRNIFSLGRATSWSWCII